MYIHNPTIADLGDYECRVLSEHSGLIESGLMKLRLDNAVDNLLPAHSRPLVDSYLSSDESDRAIVTVEEGASFELICSPETNYLPSNSSWRLGSEDWLNPYYENTELIVGLDYFEGPDSLMYVTHVDKPGFHAKRLVFKRVSYAHRRFYICFVKDEIGQHEKWVFIRVRSRYLFVRPLLGIFAEILLFLLIIYCATTRSRVDIKAEKDALNKSCKLIATFSVERRKGDFNKHSWPIELHKPLKDTNNNNLNKNVRRNAFY